MSRTDAQWEKVEDDSREMRNVCNDIIRDAGGNYPDNGDPRLAKFVLRLLDRVEELEAEMVEIIE